MPTGYTAKLHDGEDQSFEDFVLSCARAMGACIGQRDDPPGPPRLQEPSTYHAEALEQAEQKLAQLKTMTIHEAEKGARNRREKEIEYREETLRENCARLKRYRAMLSKVAQWIPPTPDYQRFKEFMAEQLKSSIKFDCHIGKWPEMPKVASGEAWRQQQIEDALSNIEYHTTEQIGENVRTEERNNWIRQLYESLGVAIPGTGKDE